MGPRSVYFLVIVVPLVISGCTNRYIVMENPETKEKLTCSSSGWGWYGAPKAASSYSHCVETLERKGFVIPGKEPRDNTLPLPPDGKSWSVRLAKAELKSGNIDRLQYERTIDHLKWEYENTIRELKAQYKADYISKSVYKQKISEAKFKYQG